MVYGSHGFLRRSRRILEKKARDRGKISIRKYLQKFNIGDIARISIDSFYRNISYPKFQGKIGKIIGRQGRAYYIEINDNGRKKTVLVCPEHLIAHKI